MKRSAFLITLIATVLVFACGPAEEPVAPVPQEVAVSSVIINSSSVSIECGASARLSATVNPSNAKDKKITWSSDNPSVATVDENGNITAIKDGSANITASAGGKTATCSVIVKPNPEESVKAILMQFYNALGGPDWTKKKGWGTDQPLNDWDGVEYDKKSGVLKLRFAPNTGLKGDIPDCIGELTGLESLNVDEPGLTGTLPESFGKLTSLKYLWIQNTSMTSLPDIFSDLTSLEGVLIQSNKKLTGPLPESLGSSPKLKSLTICNNYFTGSIPASWARLGANKIDLNNNCLSGTIPDSFLNSESSSYLLDMILIQKEGYGFDISGIEISGESYWPTAKITALDGRKFTFKEVVEKNKYTIYLLWAPWCPFSRELLPQLRDYYDLYHKKGLEVIATVEVTQTGGMWDDPAGQQKEIDEKGFGKWYNFYYPSLSPNGFLPEVPHAEVYDNTGKILFSSIRKYPDPERGRFGKLASADLMDFLEAVMGPAQDLDDYSSTDFSKDGEVTVLQKASVGKGINIVFMGDAYTDRDMGKGGLYDTVMKEAMEEFFSIEPYKSFRKRFNVYAVKVVSKNGIIGEGYETALRAHFGTGSYMGGNIDRCYEYAQKVPGINGRDNLLVTVMVNSRRHGGCAHMSGDSQSSVAFVSSLGNDKYLFGSLLNHEAGGHGFAFLDDEYFTSNSRPSQEYMEYRNLMYEKYGWFGNIDFTDDPAKIKWAAFLSDSRYKDEVGIYEGASLHAKGAYRPTQQSMMNEDIGDFNAPSRWSIYKRIMELSGETASFDKFLEYDAINRGKHQSSAPRTRSNVGRVHDAPIVILK